MWGKFRLALICFFATLIELLKHLPLWRNDWSIQSQLPTSPPGQLSAVSSETEQQHPLPMIEQRQPVNNHHDELAMKFPLWRTERLTQPELPTTRPEQPTLVSSEIEQQQPVNNHHYRAQIDNIMNMQWALLVVGACFTAISVVLQAVQIRATLPPSTFPWFCMAFEVAFLALLVSVYMRRHYHKASRVMEHVAVFFCVVALLLVSWMTLHPPFKQMSVALSFIGFTTIILANRSLRDW